MKLLKESEASRLYKTLRTLEGTEKERRILGYEKWQKAAALDAKLARAGKGTIGRNMRQVVSMDHVEFFHCIQKYGHAEVHSKEFIRFHQKHRPEQRVHKL